MKKSCLLLIIGVALALVTSCKKKSVDNPPVPNTGDVMTMPYTVSFENNFGTYTTQNVVGDQAWEIDYSTAKMAGSVKDENNNYINYDNEDWLISSPVKVADVEHAKAVMTYIGRYFYGDINTHLTIWASADYKAGELPSTATWTQVSAELAEGSNWTDWFTYEVSLDDFIGQTVSFAVKYISTTAKAGTIEIKSISITEGKANNGGQGGETQVLPYTQDFSTAFGTYIPKSVVGDQTWSIAYATAKMAGSVKENGVYVNYDNEDWLMSSPVEISGVEHAKMVLSYIGRYFQNISNDVTIWASTNYIYGEMPETAEWNQIQVSLTEGTNWDDFLTAEISLDAYIGQTITVAVKYLSTTAKAGTIEIKSISIEEGEAGGVTPPTPTPGGETQYMPYSQDFSTEFGTYLPQDVTGAQSWMIDFQTAKMTGYVSGTNYENEDWLMSSPVEVSGVEHAKIVMLYIGRYFTNINNDVTIWVSSNYEYGQMPSTATWTQVVSNLSEGTNWNDFLTAEISLDDFIGQTITVAVKYMSTNEKAGTIEIKSITIQEGEASGGVTPTPPTPGPGGGSGTAEDPYNVASGISLQDTQVIAWVQGYIVGAVKNGLSNVTSNDDVNWNAPFDSYTNVVIADDADCREIANCVIVNLPPGKPLRAQVNLVDHPDNLGKLLAVNGKLRKYFGQAGLRDSGGTEADFVLEGGVTPPPTPGTEIFSETFASGQGMFTIQDVVMPEELTYVWAHASQYSCMKASAFVGQAYATESWLISPAINISDVSTAILKFDQAVNYASPEGALSVMITTDFTDDVNTTEWTELTLSAWPAGNNWTFINSTADLTPYIGQSVNIAFKYTSTTSASATWEVKNFVISE